MWPVVVTGVVELVKSWFESKKAKHQAEIKFQEKMGEMEATWDLVALRQAQFSWKDEFITIIIFSPLILWWFPGFREDANAWVEFVGGMPYWYQFTMFGIIAATFGLRWYFRDQNFIVGDKIRG